MRLKKSVEEAAVQLIQDFIKTMEFDFEFRNIWGHDTLLHPIQGRFMHTKFRFCRTGECTGNTLGEYSQRLDEIRVKRTVCYTTVAHEIAHAIQQAFRNDTDCLHYPLCGEHIRLTKSVEQLMRESDVAAKWENLLCGW